MPGKFVSDLESSEVCAPTFRTSTVQVPLLFVPLRYLPFGRPEGPGAQPVAEDRPRKWAFPGPSKEVGAGSSGQERPGWTGRGGAQALSRPLP